MSPSIDRAPEGPPLGRAIDQADWDIPSFQKVQKDEGEGRETSSTQFLSTDNHHYWIFKIFHIIIFSSFMLSIEVILFYIFFAPKYRVV